MKTTFLFLVIFVSMILSGCSKSAGKTDAKLKLNLGGIVDFSSGIGSGGAILFGKSATGEQFGKIITNTEENLELSNGDWSFYAVMWKDLGSGKFSDRAYCGKSAQKLTGVAASISMSLNNANCADNDFSGGLVYDKYVAPDTLKHFAAFYVEDCSDASLANSFTCKKSNQGSAMSYRLAFKSYKRVSGGVAQLSTETLYSGCTNVNGMGSVGMTSNFPTSNSGMPFVVSVEMFMSAPDCNPNDPKGIFTYTFDQGLSSNSATNKIASNGGYSCNPNITAELPCTEAGGSWSGSSCSGIPSQLWKFIPVAECMSAPSAPTASTQRDLKQMVTLPTSFICRDNSTTATGNDVFPAGNGSDLRPYVICNEWQINQIGEANANATMLGNSYKLLNNLDMNKVDFNGPFPKPTCMGMAGSLITDHHNFNPLDKIIDGACNNPASVSSGFSGHFDGNNKVIANARIIAEDQAHLGFVRLLSGTGWIRNLSFKNLEVRGIGYVAGVAGSTTSTVLDTIKNIKIDRIELEAKNNGSSDGNYSGAISGMTISGTVISNAIVTNAKLRGRMEIGGLVGHNDGNINNSSFRGVIRNDSGNSSDMIGGIAGSNGGGGYIVNTFSEGAITSNATNTGGVVGINSGGLRNFYSTMAVSVNYFGPSSTASVGGITGSETGGTVYNGYFDGIVAYTGNTVLSNHKFTAGAGSSAYNNCFNDASDSPVCGTLTYATMRMGASYTIYSADAPNWIFDSNNTMTPRLVWENRECYGTGSTATVATQLSAGKGLTAVNPILICNSTQFKNMTLTSPYYYRMPDDINISNFTKADFIPSFKGVLDGTDHTLYGLNVTMGADSSESVGLINENTGTIKNLFLVGDSINNSDGTDLATGLLVGNNLGSIYNIKVRGSSVLARFDVGLIAGDNGNGATLGTIEKVDLDNVIVQGESKVGAVAGRNFTNGRIYKARVNANIGKYVSGGSSINSFGGITGYNNGIIDQARIDGSITTTVATTSATLDLGGIVGNNLGTIRNTMSVDRFRISVPETKNVGGLVGKNSAAGTINTSFALGKTIYSNLGSIATAGENLHSMVGTNLGAITNSNFLENTTASLVVDSKTTASCTIFAANDNRFTTDSTSNFTTGSASKPDAILLQNNGDVMSALIPVTIPANYTISMIPACPTDGTNFESFRLYDLTATSYGTTGTLNVDAFLQTSTFIYGGSAWDMGYLSHTNPALSIRESDILDFYKNDMYGNPIPANVPVWMMEEGEKYPNLVQLDHN